MIIKKELKSTTTMPILKRCCEGRRSKKRKRNNNNGIYSFNGYGFRRVFGDNVGEDYITIASSWYTEVSTSSYYCESKSREIVEEEEEEEEEEVEGASAGGAAGFSNNKSSNGNRPALVKTSRGRVQVLPSRFNDSILENWKKEEKTSSSKGNCSLELFDLNEEYKLPVQKKKYSSKSSTKLNKWYTRKKNSKFLVKEEVEAECEEEEERGFVGFNNFGIKRCSRAPLVEDDESIEEKILKEEFACGDVVWAKSGKRYPAWPAIVINPVLQGREMGLKSFVAGAICVMFFGYSGNEKQRDYAWVRHGMIFPFIEHLERFQEQTELPDNNSGDLRMAIEEAFLAEHGFAETNIQQSDPTGIQEATDSNQDQECNSLSQRRDSLHCDGCGLKLPFQATKKMKKSTPQGHHLCQHCARLLESKQYCGICKKIWHQSDGGSWVRCGGCKVWVHAECDRVSCNTFKDVENADYFCLDCKAKLNFESSESEEWHPKMSTKKTSKRLLLPDKISVVCTGIEGTFSQSSSSCVNADHVGLRSSLLQSGRNTRVQKRETGSLLLVYWKWKWSCISFMYHGQ